MTCKGLLMNRPLRLTMDEVIEATGEASETMARINMAEAVKGNHELLTVETYRIASKAHQDGLLVWSFMWREPHKGRRLMSARTNME